MAPTLRDHTSAARLPVFALFITYASGYVHVETFPTAFDRALHVRPSTRDTSSSSSSVKD